MAIERMWTVTELAEKLKRSEFCIREDIKSGKFGIPIKTGCRYIIPESQVEAYLENGRDNMPFTRNYSTPAKKVINQRKTNVKSLHEIMRELKAQKKKAV